eukprot:TRINITY_DN1462_c0_g1_i1.p1 TRINITY_DN1462_c0_g1~~TRINITY_DN1462_c0_g1_i1.p1  ORF type:complete len:1058 (-),score=330.24 TRINITY_DN1462_c0_g1_i1:616-3768(-)
MSVYTINDFKWSTDSSSVLGRGAYGYVYKGSYKNDTSKLVAVKVCHYDPNPKNALFRYLKQEVEIMRNLKHPNIVELLADNFLKNEVFMVMEFVGGGDLRKFLDSKPGKCLTEDVQRHFLCQIAAGLQHLHRNGIIHRDLKPANLLLNSFSDNATLKISDFGFARLAEDQMVSRVGTPLYMSPELYLYSKYTTKSDLWSVGCIAYEMLVGQVPFNVTTEFELIKRMKSPDSNFMIPPHISEPARNLITGLLQKEPAKRMSWEKFLDHPYLTPHNLSRSTAFFGTPHSQPTDLMQQLQQQAEDFAWLQRVDCIHHFGQEITFYTRPSYTVKDLKRMTGSSLKMYNNNATTTTTSSSPSTLYIFTNDGILLDESKPLSHYNFHKNEESKNSLLYILNSAHINGELPLTTGFNEEMYNCLEHDAPILFFNNPGSSFKSQHELFQTLNNYMNNIKSAADNLVKHGQDLYKLYSLYRPRIDIEISVLKAIKNHVQLTLFNFDNTHKVFNSWDIAVKEMKKLQEISPFLSSSKRVEVDDIVKQIERVNNSIYSTTMTGGASNSSQIKALLAEIIKIEQSLRDIPTTTTTTATTTSTQNPIQYPPSDLKDLQQKNKMLVENDWKKLDHFTQKYFGIGNTTTTTTPLVVPNALLQEYANQYFAVKERYIEIKNHVIKNVVHKLDDFHQMISTKYFPKIKLFFDIVSKYNQPSSQNAFAEPMRVIIDKINKITSEVDYRQLHDELSKRVTYHSYMSSYVQHVNQQFTSLHLSECQRRSNFNLQLSSNPKLVNNPSLYNTQLINGFFSTTSNKYLPPLPQNNQLSYDPMSQSLSSSSIDSELLKLNIPPIESKSNYIDRCKEMEELLNKLTNDNSQLKKEMQKLATENIYLTKKVLAMMPSSTSNESSPTSTVSPTTSGPSSGGSTETLVKTPSTNATSPSVEPATVRKTSSGSSTTSTPTTTVKSLPTSPEPTHSSHNSTTTATTSSGGSSSSTSSSTSSGSLPIDIVIIDHPPLTEDQKKVLNNLVGMGFSSEKSLASLKEHKFNFDEALNKLLQDNQ